MLNHIALVSLARGLGMDELARVSAAIQKQVSRDFAAIWEIDATVDAFARLEDVPSDYWTIVIEPMSDRPALYGIHGDLNHQPYARVAHSNLWSVVASHEALEMLTDPFGNWLVGGAAIGDPSRRVRYLVEICDPCQEPRFGYFVNGVRVSDFVTPAYYQPAASAAVRYSYNDSLHGPHRVREGGYVAWQDPTDDSWWQFRVDENGNGQTLPLPLRGSTEMRLRERIDRASGERPWTVKGLPDDDPIMVAGRTAADGVRRSSAARAKALRALLRDGARSRAGRKGRTGSARRKSSR